MNVRSNSWSSLDGKPLTTQGGKIVSRTARRPASRFGLGKNLLRFLLECAHRADVRDRTVADARDTELRQAII